ncbi:MAG: PilC/PilY family type IV pilus protein [Burkholderiales bacterium]|nr:PilC/PilY family type IV pilus protein [Burkholderiales bacterium]
MIAQLTSTLPLLRVGALVLAALAPRLACAEDIDLYAGTGGASAAPNVLFFLDNSSNWSAASQAWSKNDAQAKCASKYTTGSPQQTLCLAYVSQIFGTDTSLVQGQVELRALRLVLTNLVCSSTATLKLNAGTMLFNPNGTADGNSVISGYIRQRIAPMDATRCATLLADLALIDNKITTPDFKGPSSAEYGAPLYEAFKYFGGYTNPAGVAAETAGAPADATHFGPIRYSKPISLEDPLAFTDATRTTYASPIGDNTCGNNYIVLIGNTWPNQEYGSDTGATPHPTNLLMRRLGHSPGAQIYPVPLASSDKSNVRFADEWAKFLYSTDVSEAPTQQNVRMFTIDVYNRSPDAKQGALLKSMADTNGPGGYFSVGGDLYALVNAFTDVLTQIASVNSVFASASLPVSVNAQGTFLNQVFMGVFRPDRNGYQRWAGNLKQYQFALNGESLYLADASGAVAVDSVNTGFIQNCATSYWSADSGTYWQSISGAQPSSCATSVTSPYSDTPDGPIVERGGAAQRLRNLGHAARNIRTCKDASCKVGGTYGLLDFNAQNVPDISGLSSAESTALVNWARGQNTGDGKVNVLGVVSYTDYGLGADATRPTVHGEVVHARPLAVNYGNVGSGNDVVVFYGAGDGMLHAVNGNQSGSTAGNELWSFIAPEHWSPLNRVRTNSPMVAYPSSPTTLLPTPTPKTYFFDGSIGGYQERSSASVSKLWIYPSMRRGGNSVYAFDVTSRPGPATQPTLMWKYGPSDNANMGQSWSTPLAIRIRGRSSPLVVFGAGYDACEDNDDPAVACATVTKGRGIVVMNAESGPGVAADYRFIDPGASAGRFVADMTAVDINSDGYVDVLYAVDTRGNIWRINTSDPMNYFNAYASVNDWVVQKIASVGQWGGSTSERRKFLYAPSAVVLGNQVTVLVGTGDREKPSSTSNAALVVNRFYGIRDDVTVTSGVTPVVGYGAAPAGLYDVTGATALDPLALATYKGWFLNLTTTAPPFEQVVTTPLTISGVTYFSTYQAKANASRSSCTNLGTARAYQIDFQTGTGLPGQPLAQPFLSPGIPPSPVGGLVTINGKTIPFVIGGSGPTVLSPTKIVPKVKPDRKPIYRYQRIDG